MLNHSFYKTKYFPGPFEATGYSVNVDFTKLYDKVDVHESLSNLLGKNIKKLEENLIVFENDETIHFDNLDFKIIKDLIWW